MKQGFRIVRTVTADQIHVRDPFVFSYEKDGKYYLFGTTFADGCGNVDPVFDRRTVWNGGMRELSKW